MNLHLGASLTLLVASLVFAGGGQGPLGIEAFSSSSNRAKGTRGAGEVGRGLHLSGAVWILGKPLPRAAKLTLRSQGLASQALGVPKENAQRILLFLSWSRLGGKAFIWGQKRFNC